MMKRAKLTEICNPKQWKTIPTSELLEDGFPVYGANGIIGFYSEYNHDDPVVAITCRGATCGTVNITCPKAYVTGNAMCLDDVRSDVSIEYLYYYLLHYDFKKVISGSAQPQITRQGLQKVEIPLCSLEEQSEIVRILQKTELIIESRQRELQSLDELIKARFVEMFGTVENNVFNYPIVRLGDYAKLQGGYAFKSKDFTDNGIPLVQIGNVNKDFLNWEVVNTVPEEFLSQYDSFSLQIGDLVMAMTRPIIKSLNTVKVAKVSEADVPCLLNQRVGRFVLSDSVTAPFLEALCKTDNFKDYVERMSGNSLQPNISSKQVEDYMVILPPVPLQNAFSCFVQQIDKSKVAVQKALDEAQLLFDSLMQQYFG